MVKLGRCWWRQRCQPAFGSVPGSVVGAAPEWAQGSERRGLGATRVVGAGEVRLANQRLRTSEMRSAGVSMPVQSHSAGHIPPVGVQSHCGGRSRVVSWHVQHMLDSGPPGYLARSHEAQKNLFQHEVQTMHLGLSQYSHMESRNSCALLDLGHTPNDGKASALFRGTSGAAEEDGADEGGGTSGSRRQPTFVSGTSGGVGGESVAADCHGWRTQR